MKALITGGAGFIGSHLAEALLARGEEVCVVDDLSTGCLENLEHLKSQPRLRVVVDSILNESVMDSLVASCDVIYHLAAAVGVQLIISKPIDVIETNIFGSRCVLHLASQQAKRVILASTSEIYGKNTNIPFGEEDDRVLGPTTQKRWNYSCSKAIDEFLALAYHEVERLDVVIARLFNTIGPRQVGRYGMVVPRFVAQALSGEPLTVYADGSQTRCFTYVTDVVSALTGLMDRRDLSGKIFNVGSDESIRILDLARKVIELTGSRSEIRFVPYEQAYEQNFDDMLIRVPDLSRIRAAIGYAPRVGLDEALRRIIAHVERSRESLDALPGRWSTASA